MKEAYEGGKIMIEAKDLETSFLIQNHGMTSMRQYLVSMGTKKMFVKKPVLKGINLEIYEGECFGLIGRNGSGKSTLLRALAGIVLPEKGSVKVHGRIAPMLALGVGLEPELSGIENIRLTCALIGMTKKEINASIDDIIEFSELTQDDINMQVKRYSSGMMSRLAFSIAISSNPEILIVDEALAVGDLAFQKKCAERIDQIRSNGNTIVYVSHNETELKRICTRAACLSNGVIEKLGNVDEVVDYYNQKYT